MSLGKQVVPVLFSGGLDQKSPDQTSLPGTFARLENAVRRKAGRIDKRHGYKQLPTDISGGGVISVGRKLDRFIDELLLFDGDQSYAYSPSAAKWVKRGSVLNVAVSIDTVVRNNDVQAQPDITYNAGFSGVVYEDSRGGVRAAIYDESDGGLVIADTVLSATGRRPRAVSLGGYIYFLYQESAQLTWCRVNIANPTVLSAPTSVAGVVDMADAPWDIDKVNDSQALFAYNTTVPALKVGYILQTGTLGSTSTGAYADLKTLATQGRQALAAYVDAVNTRFFVAFRDTAGSGFPKIYGADYAMNSGSTVTSGGTDLNKTTSQIAIIVDPSDNNALLLIGDDGTIGAYDPNVGVRYEKYSWSPGAGFTSVSSAAIGLGISLGAKPFIHDNEIYVPMTRDSPLQSTYYIIRFSNNNVVAQLLPGTGGGYSKSTAGTYRSGLPRVTGLSTGVYATALIQTGSFATNNGDLTTVSRGVVRAKLDPTDSVYRGATLGSNYHLSGGVLQMYDGQSFIEHGFLLYPEYVTAASSATAGSVTPGSTYYVSTMYEWVDAKGQTHRSAPSIPVSVATGANTSIDVSVPYLYLTNKKSPRSNVKIVIYRGAPGFATPMYRDTVVTNNPAGLLTSVNLTKSDATLQAGELLYTTGDVLDNIVAPSSQFNTVHKNRLWLGGLEDGNQLEYSKEYVNGDAISFNDAQRIQCDPAGGDVTAIASLDDKLVIFKSDRIFALVGDGPVSTGALNDYQQPQFITADVGCIGPESLVITPQGLMFMSDKGLYLLDRSLGHKYIGAPVEDFNASMISSAFVMEAVNEIRFTTTDDVCLVYNYYFNQWSSFKNYTAVSAIAMNSTFYHLRNDGTAHVEVPGLYNDNGTRIPLTIETTWLSFAGLQGYQRIYRYAFLGDYLSSHYTKVQLAYDFEDSFKETVFFNVDSGLDLSYYGDDVVYGDSKVYGGPSGSSVYQFSSKPRQQKCESIKFRIEDIDTITPTGGASFDLLGLTLEIGTKRGLDKLPGGKRIGSL